MLLIIIFLLKVNIQMFLKVFLNIFLLHLTVINPTALLLLLKTFRVFLFIFFSDFVFQQIRIEDAFQVKRNYIISILLINIIDCFIMDWFASLVVICILNFDFELQNFLLCNYSFFLKLLIQIIVFLFILFYQVFLVLQFAFYQVGHIPFFSIVFHYFT